MADHVFVVTNLRPSTLRQPFFDGSDTAEVRYWFRCESCGTRMSVSFAQMLQGAWGWKERFSVDEIARITELFALGEGCKALSGGWPSISEVACASCDGRHIFYADFHEYRHSTYRIVAQGVAYAP